MKEDGLLLLVAVIALIVSVSSAGITYLSFSNLVSQITGYATGEANLTVESTVSINFSNSSVNWGSGRVNTGQTKAYLDTQSGTVTFGNWTAVSGGLVVENTGNVNLTLNLTGGKTAAQFLSGTNPAYKWNVSNFEVGSCLNATGGPPLYTQFGKFSDVNTSTELICNTFRFEAGNDTILIAFNLTVPENSLKGALGDIITATAFQA